MQVRNHKTSYLNVCRSPARKRKSSARAKCSPGHDRLPTEKGMKFSFLSARLPFPWPRKRSGLNSAPRLHFSPFRIKNKLDS